MRHYYLTRDTIDDAPYWLFWGNPTFTEYGEWLEGPKSCLGLCRLSSLVFNLPYVRKGRCILITEIKLRPGAVLSRSGDRSYIITVGDEESRHCEREWENFTYKRHHLEKHQKAPQTTVIKLKRRPSHG